MNVNVNLFPKFVCFLFFLHFAFNNFLLSSLKRWHCCLCLMRIHTPTHTTAIICRCFFYERGRVLRQSNWKNLEYFSKRQHYKLRTLFPCFFLFCIFVLFLFAEEVSIELCDFCHAFNFFVLFCTFASVNTINVCIFFAVAMFRQLSWMWRCFIVFTFYFRIFLSSQPPGWVVSLHIYEYI